MNKDDRDDTVALENEAGGSCHLPRFLSNPGFFFTLSLLVFVVSCLLFLTEIFSVKETETKEIMERATMPETETVMMVQESDQEETVMETQEIDDSEILPEYKKYYEKNSDMIGWLHIEDTLIDYPVMQTMDNEDYYLHLGFDKEYDKNGCLIMDTDSVVEGDQSSHNLIIHGHTMKSGKMFGRLPEYQDAAYGKKHNIICFDTLHEKRKYELISVFYSQVFYQTDEVFKYYKFFHADSQEEFDYWYENIKAMSLYDTGVTAEWGDEFITLSCCAYHVENGRFVVVGKRIE